MTSPTRTLYRSYIIEEYQLTQEPYYVPVADEVELFEAAYAQKIPVIFKGPTGCGKTRFIEYMSYRLGQPLTRVKQNPSPGAPEAVRTDDDIMPLVTIACHEDLTASDLVGRYLLEGNETVWIGRRWLSACTVVQPRLPERGEGPEAQHSAAFHIHRI